MKIIYTTLIASAIVLASCSENKKNNAVEIQSEEIATLNDTVEDNRGYIVQVGDMAPDFEMNMPDGSSMKLSDLKGKVIMLQFTASWCGVCREEMPFIESDIWLKHKDNKNFALFGIDREEPAETVVEFAKKTKVTYPIGLDPKADIFKLYAEAEAGITRNVIIDKDGKIAMLTRLYDPAEFKEMVEFIDDLVSK